MRDHPDAHVPRWAAIAALVVGGLRYVAQFAGLLLIPVLVPHAIPELMLLRPGKEVILLGGGFSAAEGDPGLLWLVLAFLPMGLFAAWVFFPIGRAYADVLRSDEGPAWLRRVLPPERVRIAQRVLARRGPMIAVLGRLAALPPSIVLAAAGASDVRARTVLVGDTIGAALQFAITIGVGLALGAAYETAGPWVSIGGGVVFLALITAITRWVRHEAQSIAAEDAPLAAASDDLVAPDIEPDDLPTP